MDTRNCTRCGTEKPITSFAQAGKDPRYRRKVCNGCRDKRNRSNNKEARARWRKSHRQQNHAQYIREDSRRDDKKAGRENDLTVKFIEAQIDKGCSYCGEGALRMTLDRIDNTKGHTMTNVVPACIRCNYTRGNMPYEAWLVVAKGMQEARERNLFGEWTGRCR